MNRKQLRKKPTLERNSMKSQVNATINRFPLQKIATPDRHMSQAGIDGVPLIYMCATMWHENKQEMTTFFGSIFKYKTTLGSLGTCWIRLIITIKLMLPLNPLWV